VSAAGETGTAPLNFHSTRDTTRPVDDSDYRLEPLAAFVPPDTPLTGIFGENSAGCLANRRG